MRRPRRRPDPPSQDNQDNPRVHTDSLRLVIRRIEESTTCMRHVGDRVALVCADAVVVVTRIPGPEGYSDGYGMDIVDKPMIAKDLRILKDV